MLRNPIRYRVVQLSVTVVVLGTALFASTACSSARQEIAEDMFRDPHPTFTPTAGAPGAGQAVGTTVILPAQTAVAMPSVDDTAVQPVLPLPTPTEIVGSDNPTCVVNAPLVNLRAESNARSEIVEAVERGTEFEIVGRSNDDQWWQVCCYADRQVWIAQELVDIIGDADNIPIADRSANEAPLANAGGPVAAFGGNVGVADSNARFELESKEQFSKEGSVRIYVYIHDGDTPLAGYGIRVLKDGQEVPTDDVSFGGQPGTTWPFQDARQRHQNLKIELEGTTPAGSWSVQPINDLGLEVGPPAQFTLLAGDANLELYVRYRLTE